MSAEHAEPYRNHDQYDAADMQAVVGIANGLLTELRAAVGYMRNAKIDLETGATKATAIRTIAGGIKRAEEAIAKAEARDAL